MFNRMDGDDIGLCNQSQIIVMVGIIAVFTMMALIVPADNSLLGITAALILFAILLLVDPMSQKAMNQSSEQDGVESEALLLIFAARQRFPFCLPPHFLNVCYKTTVREFAQKYYILHNW